jgi:hypothetical protein
VQDHLTEEQIKSYRKLPAEQLFLIDDHLVSCERCRSRLFSFQNAGRHSNSLKTFLSDATPDHLLFEQLKAYVDGDLDETDREIIESHLSICNQCKKDSYELQQARKDLSGHVENRSFGNQVRFLWRSSEFSTAFRSISLAAIAAFVALLAFIIFQPQNGRLQSKLDETTEQNRKLKEKLHLLETHKETPIENTKPLLVSLLDGNGRIDMDDTGKVWGMGSYPEAYRDDVQNVLTKGNLPFPSWLKNLGSPSGVVRGEETNQNKTFSVISPVAQVTQSDRPVFRWNPMKGALQYEVKVFDNRFNVVASSSPIFALSWTPNTPLKRGQIYTWQVDAIRKDERITTPLSPAPEAKFKILEEEKFKELENVKKNSAGSHLLMAIAYSENGLLEEAAQEIEKLKKANPDSLFVEKLSSK